MGTNAPGVESAKHHMIISPKTSVTVNFVPHNETMVRVSFRVSAVTDDGLKFCYTVRANVAPRVSTVIAISPYFNRAPVLPWFVIGMTLFGIVCGIVAFSMILADRV